MDFPKAFWDPRSGASSGRFIRPLVVLTQNAEVRGMGSALSDSHSVSEVSTLHGDSRGSPKGQLKR